MSTNRPLDITPPPPPSAPGGAALPVPTAEPCVHCHTTGGYVEPASIKPWRGRGLCKQCYNWHAYHGSVEQFPHHHAEREMFEGFPEGYTHEPTGWPLVPALVAPLHPTLPAPNRWGNVIWFRRPQHDPVGQKLFDRETRYDEREAA